MNDDLILGGLTFKSRLLTGTGKFSLNEIENVIDASGTEIITLALRRVNAGGEANILDHIPPRITLMPNTSGARNAKEAIRIAHLGRELGCGDLVKIEIIPDTKYLMPDNAETVKATEALAKDGFVVMPYINPDLVTARALAAAGAASVMPLGAPIGSNRGLCTKDLIKMLIAEIDLPVIVDAGIGKPSHACEAMELGAAAVLVNTAIATANNPALMAEAFKQAVIAGRNGYLAGAGRVIAQGGEASSPLTSFLEN